jgi:hypothetical protein
MTPISARCQRQGVGSPADVIVQSSVKRSFWSGRVTWEIYEVFA